MLSGLAKASKSLRQEQISRGKKKINNYSTW